MKIRYSSNVKFQLSQESLQENCMTFGVCHFCQDIFNKKIDAFIVKSINLHYIYISS